METQNKDLPEIGYLFHEPNLDHTTDRYRMDVFVSSISTEKHFDVRHAIFRIKNQRDQIETLIIRHPWELGTAAHVCPGLIILEDRLGKKEEAFSFGGELTIESREQQTICSLSSNAPILEISAATPLNKLFIDTVEIILAKQRAALAQPQDFEVQLCHIDPFDLYLACLDEIRSQSRVSFHRDDVHLSLQTYVETQFQMLDAAGLISPAYKNLKKLFG